MDLTVFEPIRTIRDLSDNRAQAKSKRRITIWPFGSISFCASFKKCVAEPQARIIVVVVFFFKKEK